MQSSPIFSGQRQLVEFVPLLAPARVVFVQQRDEALTVGRLDHGEVIALRFPLVDQLHILMRLARPG